MTSTADESHRSNTAQRRLHRVALRSLMTHHRAGHRSVKEEHPLRPSSTSGTIATISCSPSVNHQTSSREIPLQPSFLNLISRGGDNHVAHSSVFSVLVSRRFSVCRSTFDLS